MNVAHAAEFWWSLLQIHWTSLIPLVIHTANTLYISKIFIRSDYLLMIYKEIKPLEKTLDRF